MYIKLNHCAIYLKLTQHCKSIFKKIDENLVLKTKRKKARSVSPMVSCDLGKQQGPQ